MIITDLENGTFTVCFPFSQAGGTKPEVRHFQLYYWICNMNGTYSTVFWFQQYHVKISVVYHKENDITIFLANQKPEIAELMCRPANNYFQHSCQALEVLYHICLYDKQ